MSLLARTGRERQRYEDHMRLVSGCIPYRNDRLEKRFEILMLTSPNRNDLVFPKGGWEDDETVEEAACREALEEAGVRGILSDKPIGTWEFRSKSSQEESCSSSSPVGVCKGHMFALEVTEELKAWPEKETHNRRWLTVKEAFQLCRYEWMRQALLKFVASTKREALDGWVDSSYSQNHCTPPVVSAKRPELIRVGRPVDCGWAQ